MVLRITDRPPLLHPKDITGKDQYELTLAAIESRNYEELARILQGERGVRQLAAVPTVLLQIAPRQYANIIKGAKKYGVETKLLACFRVAHDLARNSDVPINADLENIVAQSSCQAKTMLPYEEFQHIYDVYKNVRFP